MQIMFAVHRFARGARKLENWPPFPWICKALKLPRIESCPFDSYIPNFYLLSSLSDTELPISFKARESVLPEPSPAGAKRLFSHLWQGAKLLEHKKMGLPRESHLFLVLRRAAIISVLQLRQRLPVSSSFLQLQL